MARSTTSPFTRSGREVLIAEAARTPDRKSVV